MTTNNHGFVSTIKTSLTSLDVTLSNYNEAAKKVHADMQVHNTVQAATREERIQAAIIKEKRELAKVKPLTTEELTALSSLNELLGL